MAINFLNRLSKRSICVQQRIDSNKDIYTNKKADSGESAFSISAGLSISITRGFFASIGFAD